MCMTRLCCLQQLWSLLFLRSRRTSIGIHYDKSLLWGEWALVSASNFAEFNQVIAKCDKCAMTRLFTDVERMLVTLAFSEESNEWILSFESRFGLVVNRYTMNEEVNELTYDRRRVDAINKMIDVNTIFSRKTMKSGQEWTTLRKVDPSHPNTMTVSMTINDTNTILTYKRLESERENDAD